MARGELGLLFFLIVIILFGEPTLKELKEVWLWIAFLRCSSVPIFLVTLNLCLSSCPSKHESFFFIKVPHVVINNYMDLQGHWKRYIFMKMPEVDFKIKFCLFTSGVAVLFRDGSSLMLLK